MPLIGVQVYPLYTSSMYCYNTKYNMVIILLLKICAHFFNYLPRQLTSKGFWSAVHLAVHQSFVAGSRKCMELFRSHDEIGFLILNRHMLRVVRQKTLRLCSLAWWKHVLNKSKEHKMPGNTFFFFHFQLFANKCLPFLYCCPPLQHPGSPT